MKYVLSAIFVAVLPGVALATPPVSVPEVGMSGSLAAIAAVAAVGALAWERRRKDKNR